MMYLVSAEPPSNNKFIIGMSIKSYFHPLKYIYFQNTVRCFILLLFLFLFSLVIFAYFPSLSLSLLFCYFYVFAFSFAQPQPIFLGFDFKLVDKTIFFLSHSSSSLALVYILFLKFHWGMDEY